MIIRNLRQKNNSPLKHVTVFLLGFTFLVGDVISKKRYKKIKR